MKKHLWIGTLVFSWLIIWSLIQLQTIHAAEGDQKPINSICPVTGRAIDPTLPPVVVVIGKGDKAKRVIIGIAERNAAAQIKSDPQKFAEAAKQNNVAR